MSEPTADDAILEELSDKVRRGEPIGFLDALAVVHYQERLRAEREDARRNSLLGRLKRWPAEVIRKIRRENSHE